MVIIRYNEPQGHNSFMCTANDFYYSNETHTLQYLLYDETNQLVWIERKDVKVELNNLGAVPVLYVMPYGTRPNIFEQPKDVQWSENIS